MDIFGNYLRNNPPFVFLRHLGTDAEIEKLTRADD